MDRKAFVEIIGDLVVSIDEVRGMVEDVKGLSQDEKDLVSEELNGLAIGADNLFAHLTQS